MAFLRGILVAFPLVAVLAAFVSLRAEPQDPARTDPGTRPAPSMLGSASCAAAACHGSPSAPSLTAAPDRSCWQSSVTVVQSVDPHRNAYQTLLSERSREIARKLKAGPNGTVIEAHRDVRCLACHTTPQAAANESLTAVRSEGVSCEACHGPASNWRIDHTTWTTPERRSAGIASTGFNDLNGHSVRAQTCAGCHIGDAGNPDRPVRDMNHDMIAAGHPRLTFDYLTHLERLPKHWQEKNRTLPGAPARTAADWSSADAAGEAAAKRALEVLTTDRRNRTDGRTPMPEFAGQSCFSCHRTLSNVDETSWRARDWEQAEKQFWTLAGQSAKHRLQGGTIPPEQRELLNRLARTFDLTNQDRTIDRSPAGMRNQLKRLDELIRLAR